MPSELGEEIIQGSMSAKQNNVEWPGQSTVLLTSDQFENSGYFYR